MSDAPKTKQMSIPVAFAILIGIWIVISLLVYAGLSVFTSETAWGFLAWLWQSNILPSVLAGLVLTVLFVTWAKSR